MADKTPSPSPSAAATDAFRSQFFFTASSLIVVCFFLQALPLGVLGRTFAVAGAAAYRTGFFTATVAHGYRLVYTLKPKIAAAASNGSAGLQAAAPGLARELLSSNSFLYTLYCLLFLMSRPTALAMVPVAFTSLLQALTFLVKNPPASPSFRSLWDKYGERGYGLLQETLPVSLGMCATSQVMIGITLLLGLLSSNREVAKTLVYWNIVLRGFFHCGDATVFRMKLPASSSTYHKQAWQAIDAKVAPLTSRVPALNRAKEAAANWFRG